MTHFFSTYFFCSWSNKDISRVDWKNVVTVFIAYYTVFLLFSRFTWYKYFKAYIWIPRKLNQSDQLSTSHDHLIWGSNLRRQRWVTHLVTTVPDRPTNPRQQRWVTHLLPACQTDQQTQDSRDEWHICYQRARQANKPKTAEMGDTFVTSVPDRPTNPRQQRWVTHLVTTVPDRPTNPRQQRWVTHLLPACQTDQQTQDSRDWS